MSNETAVFLNMLVECLQLLAAPYDQQIHAFPPFVHIPDELALTFYDAVLLTDNLLRESFITPVQKAEVERLNMELEQMSKNKELWTKDALRNASVWEQIRRSAKDILQLFNEKPKKPDLFWIQYVPADNTVLDAEM